MTQIEDNRGFSERLKQARRQKGLTQNELGEMIQQKKTTISNYETGYSTPSNKIIVDLADALGVTTDYLLGRVDSPTGYKSELYNVHSSEEHHLIEQLSQLDKPDTLLIRALVQRLNRKN